MEKNKEKNCNISSLLDRISLPEMARYRQHFNNSRIDDPCKELEHQLSSMKERIKPGMKVAITAGSRGINNIADFIKTIVEFVRDQGADPFVFPAMGSHAGANADWQKELLKGYGITEEYLDCPIMSSMEVVKIGEEPEEKLPVYVDQYAAAADAVIVMNRIKPHTGFTSDFGSGLAKMMSIGMGKQKGADSMHNAGFGVFARRIPAFAKVILGNVNIVFGVAIVENAYDETLMLKVIPAESILKEEPGLLRYAKDNMAKIMIPETDILVVQTIGKNFAGTGMDANITGTFSTPYASGGIKKKRTVVLDLSAESEGNAFGIGKADFTTRRLFEKIDFYAMYPNPLTSTVVEPCFIPMVLDSDELAIKAAIKTCNGIDKENPKIVYIRNTNEMSEIWLSKALWEEAASIQGLERVGIESFEFDSEGNLTWI